MKRIMAAVVLLFASLGFAQSLDKGNVYFGYAYGHIPSQNTNGWNGSLEGRVLPHISLVADFNGSYTSSHSSSIVAPGSVLDVRTNNRIHTFMFGPRAYLRIGKLRPFGHVLIGVAHYDSTFDHALTINGLEQPDFSSHLSGNINRFGMILGGGTDVKLTKTLDWRMQADYLRIAPFQSDGSNNARISTGLVFRF